MKKLFFLAAIVTAANTFAQKSQFGFTGGATLANYKIKIGGAGISGSSRVGFTLGFVANIKAGNSFCIQPALNWVQKGTEQKNPSAAKSTLTTNHLEVPVNFIYSNNGFFIGAGPSVAIGISGKSKADDGTKTKVNYGNSDNDDLKAFDFGLNGLTGFKFKSGFTIAANYNLGLLNLAPGTNNGGGSLKSMYGGIRLGYWLKSKKN